MGPRIASIILTFAVLACSDSVLIDSADIETVAEHVKPPKSDEAYSTAVSWANSFFITQIYDQRWNPTGSSTDIESNNCGPASFAMLMSQRNRRPDGLTPSEAMDHARALMYAAYPHIDDSLLAQNAVQYMSNDHVCISDAQQSVYFDLNGAAPSIAQGIQNTGSPAVFGYSWNDIRDILEQSESLIAHGHITDDWRRSFPGEYGQYADGGVPHFIAVFSTSNPQSFLVCDPMHLGGPTIMAQHELHRFFKSPINVYETTIRVIGYPDSSMQNTVIQDERANEPQ